MKLKDSIKEEDPNNGNTPWTPTYKWLGITASVILLVLIIAFFVLNILLKPYMRVLPLSITPWLDKSKNEAQVQQPKQIEQDEQNDADQSAAE